MMIEKMKSYINLCLVLILLSGCSSPLNIPIFGFDQAEDVQETAYTYEYPEKSCAQAFILKNARTLMVFLPEEETTQRIHYEARLSHAQISCEYNEAKAAFDTKDKFAVSIKRGALKSVDPQADIINVSYFIALVEEDTKIIHKKTFEVTFNIKNNERNSNHIREIELEFPVQEYSEDKDYKIITGLILNDEQLKFNNQ